MLHGVSVRLLHDPPLDQVTALLTRLRADGCDAVSIIVQHNVLLDGGTNNLAAPPSGNPDGFFSPELGPNPARPPNSTPEPAPVLKVCKTAAGLGMRVMLAPRVESYQAAWRGDISVKDRAANWASGYRDGFLQGYLDIAKQLDGTILCLGSELYTVTKELGPDFWIGLAAWVRGQGFAGPLTYAASARPGDAGPEYKLLSGLWPHLDFVGVDGFLPLFPAGYVGPTDTASLAAAWHGPGAHTGGSPIDDDLLAVSHASGKPLLFTAIGYPNLAEAAIDPEREAHPGDTRDDDIQRRMADAFHARWDGEAALAGYFWWEALIDQAGKPEIGHDIIDRPVEQAVFGPALAFAPPAATRPQPTLSTDYPLLGRPSITREVFIAALAAANSPVLQEADGGQYFDLCVQNNVDPAVALAFFQQETNSGTAPGAAGHKNWGNLWDVLANTLAIYPTWLLGLRDWCARLQGPAYIAGGPPTISSIVPLYRGSRPDNDQYIAEIDAKIAALRSAPHGLVASLGDAIRRAAIGPQPPVPSIPLTVQPPVPSVVPASQTPIHSMDAGPPGVPPSPVVTPLSLHIGWNDRPHGPEFYFESNPTISPDIFAAQLLRRNSPVLQEADPLIFYHAVLDRSLNPAAALGFFGKESQYGADLTSPVVQADAKNWGNLTVWDLAVGPPYGRAPRTVHITAYGETHDFRVYDTWMDGLLDWCDAVLNPPYKGKTIREALKTYVGATYNSYADTLQGWMQAWDKASGDFDIPLLAAPVPQPQPPSAYMLLGPPSIARDAFSAVLAAAYSPVLQEADGGQYFDLCAQNNVDPAVALAFFAQETNYGTLPGAPAHKNWGNLWDATAKAIETYATWLLGLNDWCIRLQGRVYTAGGPPSIASIVPRYRGNRADNADYIKSICAKIDLLRAVPRHGPLSGP